MAKINTARKIFRKVTHKVGRAIKKRYTKKGTLYKGLSLNTSQIYKDVARLKTMVNSEKKFVEVPYSELTVGQCNVNVAGYIFTDISPVPNEGITQQTRNGASIKLNSTILRMQFRQMINLHTAMRIKILVIRVNKQVVPITFATMTTIFKADAISNVIDYNSIRNPDYFGDYSILATRHVTIPADNYNGMTNRFRDLQMNLRTQFHVRYAGDTNTVTNNQILLLMLADTGNLNTTTASTLTKIANTVANSGAFVDMFITQYYYDN
jgi:hypothetical protein